MALSVPMPRTSHASALESEVHVWLARPGVVADSAHQTDCIALLCADEIARYRRFRFAQDRRLYLVSRTLLRRVLSTYADIEPADWRFTRGAYGRPEIAGPASALSLRFNLSHTQGLAACVVTLESDCGIDVERIVGRRMLPEIAAKVFAEPEQRDLCEREGTAGYRERFFTYWTLREAWCKALGTGLAHADRSAWFELDEAGACRIHGHSGQPGAGGYWQTAVMRPTAEHVLALAVHGAEAVDKPVVCRFIEP
jgi:4'-phosphopantetheinyl transferase